MSRRDRAGRAFVLGHGESARRLGVTPIDMNCAHGPMPSAPAALAKIREAV